MEAVVAAGDSQTAAAAAEVLRRGGNAVDAAIAGSLAAFVAEPLLASAGGGGVMTIALAGGQRYAIDFFALAPRRAVTPPTGLDFEGVEVDFGAARQIFHAGRGSAAVPGALPGLAAAFELGSGTLSLLEIADPAIRMARAGVTLSAETVHVYRLLWPIMMRDAETLAIFAPTGDPPEPGSRLVLPEMADALEAFGREVAIPESVLRACDDAFGPACGGLLAADDLRAYAPEIADPLEVVHEGWTVLLPRTAGGRLVEIIVRALAREPAASDEVDELVRIARASRVGHAARDSLIAPGSTTHLSVIDAAGGAAAVTLTNGEGCGHVAMGTSIQLNNFLGEEDLNPRGFHRHAPGARLATMMAPTVALRDGRAALVLGSGGSNRIRSAVSAVLYRAAFREEPIEDAVRAPRIHAESTNVWLELDGLRDPDRALDRLREEFDGVCAFARRDFFFGGVHAVGIDRDGRVVGVGDTRRGGGVARA